MIVTGDAMTAGLIDDPTVSAIAFDSAELQNIGAQDVSSLARFTPSLEINTTSATTPTFFIRGVGLNDANSNAVGAIAIYVDNVPINSAAIQLTSLFDTQTVEVLRGPQAFFDARNASGGMINTVTRKPDGEFSSYLRGDYGNYGYYDLEGALGFPIVGETVSGRFAFRRTFRDDLFTNRCGGLSVPDTGPGNSCNEAGTTTGGKIPAGLPDETNDVDRYAWRYQTRFAPDVASEMEWLLNVHSARIDQTSPLGQAIGTQDGVPYTAARYIDPAIKRRFDAHRLRFQAQGLTAQQASTAAHDLTLDQVTRDIDLTNPFENDYDLVGDERLGQWGGFVRGDMELGSASIMTISAVEQWDRERVADFDFTAAPMIHVDREDDAIQFSEDIAVDVPLEIVPVTLQAGGYLLVERLDSSTQFLLQRNSSLSGRRDIVQSYEQNTYSFGLFGSFAWKPVEEFTLEAGARLNWERKSFDLEVARILPNVSPRVGFLDDVRTWSAPTYGVNLTYHMTEDLLAFVKYTRGWKAGHFNASVITIPGQDNPVIPTNVAKPETIDSAELGMDAAFLSGALTAKGAMFFYKYQNYQVFLLQSQNGSPPQLEILNASGAQIFGIEADTTLRPFDLWPDVPEEIQNLTLSLNFAWLESEFLEFSTNRVAFLPSDPGVIETNVANQTVDFTGNPLPNTPKIKLSATIEWGFDVGAVGTFTPRYDVSWTDDVFFDPSNGVGSPAFGITSSRLPKYAVAQRGYARHDLRLTYANPGGNVSIAGWVRNLTDERFKQNVLDVSSAFDLLVNFIGDPRTYGISTTIRF